MKVYCVFKDYDNSYPEDRKSTLLKIFDSKDNANAFIDECLNNGTFFYDEEYDICVSGRIEEHEVHTNP